MYNKDFFDKLASDERSRSSDVFLQAEIRVLRLRGQRGGRGLGDALEGIVAEAAAACVGADRPLSPADHGVVIRLYRPGAVGAGALDLSSEQH